MHTAEGRSIRVLMSLGITAGLAGFVAYYPTTSLGQETRPNPTVKSIMTDAAIARIAAESRGILREPPIEAAPRFSETPVGGDRTGRESRPSPPNGYSFVSYHGEMLRARIEGEGAVGEERLGTDLDWLGSTTSIETLAAHAAAAGRDWSFGWIRLAEDADPNDFARSLQGSGAPGRYFRPAVFICDEYQAFASVGEDDPSGDEKSFALTRQCRCIPIVATQSISSLRPSWEARKRGVRCCRRSALASSCR